MICTIGSLLFSARAPHLGILYIPSSSWCARIRNSEVRPTMSLWLALAFLDHKITYESRSGIDEGLSFSDGANWKKSCIINRIAFLVTAQLRPQLRHLYSEAMHINWQYIKTAVFLAIFRSQYSVMIISDQLHLAHIGGKQSNQLTSIFICTNGLISRG
jgi:hypothetical protein